MFERLHDRVLNQLFGKIEIAEKPYQGSDKPRSLVAKDGRNGVRAYGAGE